MRSTKEKAELCRALHAGAEPTLSAACWDVGTACLPAHVGVPLIDTTRFGAMATRGLSDAVNLLDSDLTLLVDGIHAAGPAGSIGRTVQRPMRGAPTQYPGVQEANRWRSTKISISPARRFS